MKFSANQVIIGFALLAVTLGLSSCQFSTANITAATMAIGFDSEANQPLEPTNKYRMWMPTFTCAVQLANVPSDTKVKAVWFREIEGTSYPMDSTEIALETDGWMHFTLTRSRPAWAYGTYHVDLYLNGTFDRKLTFDVEATYPDAPLSEIILSTGETETGSPMPPMNTFASSTEPIYCFVYANEPTEATKYGIVWYQEAEEGLYSLASAELIHDASGWITFSLTQENPLPQGRYFADILINDESFGKLEFTIE